MSTEREIANELLGEMRELAQQILISTAQISNRPEISQMSERSRLHLQHELWKLVKQQVSWNGMDLNQNLILVDLRILVSSGIENPGSKDNS